MGYKQPWETGCRQILIEFMGNLFGGNGMGITYHGHHGDGEEQAKHCAPSLFTLFLPCLHSEKTSMFCCFCLWWEALVYERNRGDLTVFYTKICLFGWWTVLLLSSIFGWDMRLMSFFFFTRIYLQCKGFFVLLLFLWLSFHSCTRTGSAFTLRKWREGDT